MALTLTRRESSPIPLEVFGLTPDKLIGMSAAEISRLKVRHGNREEEVGDLFDITHQQEPDDLTIEFNGDCSTIKGIGAGMSGGHISAGSVGPHAGAGMTGGNLAVQSAGDWLGTEMAGGRIFVTRDAGHHVGSVYPGGRRGMRGGTIRIGGNAGDSVGSHMRRGLIVVRGRVGEFCGSSMIAGTIVVDGTVGPHCGAGMKRGTIVTFGPEFAWAPGFVYACDYKPAYAEVVRRELTDSIDRPIDSVRLYRGDLTTGGRGEIWHIPQAV
jgi:formylmethanofuran dehydrogenase subunit C